MQLTFKSQQFRKEPNFKRSVSIKQVTTNNLEIILHTTTLNRELISCNMKK